MKKFFKFILISTLLLIGTSNIALAECSDDQTKLEIKLPFLSGCVNGPADYLAGIYKLSLGVGVFMAAIVIVMAGVKYAISGDNASKQKEAKDDIFQAIFGLVVLFGSVIILRTINPDLADLSKWQSMPVVTSSRGTDNAQSEECRELLKARKDCIEECEKDTAEDGGGAPAYRSCTEIYCRPSIFPGIDSCIE